MNTLQEQFTLTELEKTVKEVKNISVDKHPVHPKVLNYRRPETELAVVSFFNLCWTLRIRPGGSSKLIFSGKRCLKLMTFHQIIDPSQ